MIFEASGDDSGGVDGEDEVDDDVESYWGISFFISRASEWEGRGASFSCLWKMDEAGETFRTEREDERGEVERILGVGEANDVAEMALWSCVV